MTLPRRISLSAHGLLELMAGLALLVAAFALDLGAVGTVVTFTAGVTVAGIGLVASDSMPLAMHQSLDRALVVGLSAGAVLAALDGGAVAAVLLLATATAELALVAGTRWRRHLTA